MEKLPMTMTLAWRAAPLLIATALVAGPVWAQGVGSQSEPTATTPSGTSGKAVPHTRRSATERPAGETVQALVDQRIAELHTRLRITPQQSQQWDQFAQVMRDNAKEMDDLYRQRASQLGSMSAVQNMQSYEQIEEARAQQTQKLVPAFQTLYASFSDQQKAEADRIFQYRSARAEARHHQASRQ
jgi:periplasmic protein CpxP/Spy